jgi:Raf kinase inhibitor-like YbhB/YbcL family protein
MSMQMSSDAFDDGDVLPDRYVRSGDNVAPPLDWNGVPSGASELVLLCEDIDAGEPHGPPFLHWVLTGLDADLDGIGEGEQIEGSRPGPNGFGTRGYEGPEPPPGAEHRYVFTLVAVSSPLDPDAVDNVRTELPARELDRTTLSCRYGA